jgi:soluble lytic murein transglycosylase-like protein
VRGRAHSPRAAIVTGLLLLVGAALLAPDRAEATRAGGPPSQAQLTRLTHFEKYIDYFTSVSYGSGKVKVSSSYIRSLICAESSANPRARSNKGARGLSQIMPETGRIAARELYESGIDFQYVDERRLKNLRAEDLYDPAINILIACYLSATYLDQFLGRHDLVVSAWNAGPGAVMAHGNRPPPYQETHQLMARVRGYMTYFDDGSELGWRTASWTVPGTGAGWHRVPDLPSRGYVKEARRAAQRVIVPEGRASLGSP